MINISLEPIPDDPRWVRSRRTTIEMAANRWAAMGWRTVAVIPSQSQGYADVILVERRKER